MPTIWKGREKKLWTLLLWIGCCVVYAARTSMPLCVPQIAKDLNWSKQQSGVVLSSFFCGYFLSQILGGYTADHVGGERVVVWAGCVWSLCTFITPWLLYYYHQHTSMPMLLIVVMRVSMGLAQGVHYPSVSSITSRHCKAEERTLIYSTIVAGSHIGTLFTGSFGSYILEVMGWHWVFYIIGTLGLLWTFVMKFLSAKLKSLELPPSTDSDRDGATEALMSKPSSSGTKPPWKSLLCSAAVWSIIIGHFCENTAFFILLSWLPSYFNDKFPQAKGWVYNVVPWVPMFPMCVLGGWLANKMIVAKMKVTFVRKILETCALLGCALFLYLLHYTESFLAALLCLTLALAINGFHNSGILVNPQDIAPNHAGSVFGIMNMAGALPGVFGVYLTGWMLNNSPDDWTSVFHLISSVLCVGWLVFTIFGTGRQIV